jgi:CBS domain-containing membrane protein
VSFLVRDLMTPDPTWVHPTATGERCARLMIERHIHHVPVVDHAHNVVGIVSQRDLIARGLIGPRNQAVAHPPDEAPVSVFMTRILHVVAPADPVVKAASMMKNNGYSCLPVVERGRLVGIVTASDFLSLVVRHADLFGDNSDDDLWAG